MKATPTIKPKYEEGIYYVWVGGSCDYGHEERCSGGAYIMEKDGKVIDEYVISDDPTTEFRMILTVMIHAMEVTSDFLTFHFLLRKLRRHRRSPLSLPYLNVKMVYPHRI